MEKTKFQNKIDKKSLNLKSIIRRHKEIIYYFYFLFYLNNYLLYIFIYIVQEYNSLLPLNEECIFDNVSLVVVNMNNDIKKVVNIKIPFYLYVRTNYLIINIILTDFLLLFLNM